ncbi:MAG TPA: hypothetical protein VFI11_08990, partial [Anaerolineales bacterium]|nr:hypothetical protein [Anaerolineales bacterium]
QMVGDADSGGYDRLVAKLAAGSPLEQRAAVAAVAEPRLLASAEAVRRGLRILDKTTRSLTQLPKPLDEKARVLRQALGYAWSVLVVANPELGKPAMEAWLRSSDVDVRWLMAQNLAKKRLLRLDSAWCAEWSRRLRSKSQTGSRRSSASKARRKIEKHVKHWTSDAG